MSKQNVIKTFETPVEVRWGGDPQRTIVSLPGGMFEEHISKPLYAYNED